MSKQRWMWSAAGVLAWVCIGAAVTGAAEIPPVGGTGTATISILAADGSDITDTYLPTWKPGAPLQRVFVVVNGTGTAPTQGATTSHLGNCTNYGTDPGSDFTLATSSTPVGGRTGYALDSNDCGGRVVIVVGSDSFVVPKDVNDNLIPDSLEVFGVALTPEGDPDGDGLTTFDETVRGFIIGGQHKRLNPTVKNLFGFLVKGQCGTSLLTTNALPVPTGLDPGPLDANLRSLVPAAATVPPGIEASQVHFLGDSLSGSTTAIRTDEWVDHFVSFSLGGSGTTETWTYCNDALAPGATCGTGTVAVTPASNTPAAPATDRVVNKNRVYGGVQKGFRGTECATTVGTTPQGTGRLGNITTGKNEAVIYTDRIRRWVASYGTSTANIWYSTFTAGAWTPIAAPSTGLVGGGSRTATTQARNFITLKGIQYVLATEVGHDGGLIGDVNTNPSFPHLVAGTGDNMDEAMRAVTSGSPSGVKFYIPSLFNNLGQSTFQLSAPTVIE